MYDFDLIRPTTLAEAVSALQDEDAQPLAGGQTLIPTLRARLAAPSVLVSLTDIAEMKGIARDGTGPLTIGGGATHAEVAAGAADFPALAEMARHIGCPAVRNRGTIGGSLANDDPSACYPAAVLACDAVIVTDRREIAAADYFQGMFTTALEEGEIITAVRIPVPKAASYQKFAQPASRFALVGVFVAQFSDCVKVGVTGASEDGVFCWDAAGSALSEDFSAAALDGLSLSGDGMISDLHGTGEYRAHLTKVMTKRAVTAAR